MPPGDVVGVNPRALSAGGGTADRRPDPNRRGARQQTVEHWSGLAEQYIIYHATCFTYTFQELDGIP